MKTTDRIRRIKASMNPLSADVVIIDGKDSTWIYDVGCCDAAYEELNSIEHKNIVISHFHPDHMANLNRLEFDKLYVGKNTYKYTKQGIIVEDILTFADDHVQIVFMPSSHAKGSLALLVDEYYLLVGDAFYPQQKNGERVYNVQHVKSQIDLLKNTRARLIGISHQEEFFKERDAVLDRLQRIYEMRNGNDAFVSCHL